MTLIIVKKPGSGLSIIYAKSNEKHPAVNPFTITIVNGSLADMFLVKLLSIPQHLLLDSFFYVINKVSTDMKIQMLVINLMIMC